MLGTFQRDDYRELNELIVAYLGGTVSGVFKPKRKGAMHEARFMADCIYLLSMELFSGEYVMDSSLQMKVHKMAVFISVWHGPMFLKCSIPTKAPEQDLSYFHDMLEISDIEDPLLSNIGVKVAESIQRHTAYLKPSQVVFALFDEEAEDAARRQLADALAAITRPGMSVLKSGKVAEVPLLCSLKECVGTFFCQDDDGNGYPRKQLPEYLTSRSYLLFNLLKIEDLSWLKEPVSVWPNHPSYILCHDVVTNLVVTNDGAERGIKLMQELIDRTSDESQLQHLAQCVSHHRKLIGHTKKDYEKL